MRGTVFAAVIALTALRLAPAGASETLLIRPEQKEVRVLATAHPGRFQGLLARIGGMSGYHLAVWESGRAARHALFTTVTPDSALHNALVHIGAVPGNALGIDSWNQRNNPDHSAPDRRIVGSPVDIFVQWSSREPMPLADLIEDPGGKGFDFRFGGHLENQAAWHSGCGVCLYSCPGGKIGNAAYTVREYIEGATKFRIRANRFPPKGTDVTLIFRLRE